MTHLKNIELTFYSRLKKNIRHISNFCATFVIFILMTVTCNSAHCYVSIATIVRSAQHCALLHLSSACPVSSAKHPVQQHSIPPKQRECIRPQARDVCVQNVRNYMYAVVACWGTKFRPSHIWCFSCPSFSNVHLLIASPYSSLIDLLHGAQSIFRSQPVLS